MDFIYSLKVNSVLLILLIVALLFPFFPPLLFLVSSLTTLIVIIAALRSLLRHQINVDQLASIALIVSFINHQWYSVAFINLMIVSARIFGIYTESKAKSTIKSLLKLRPSTVKIKKANAVVTIPIEHVKAGDLIFIESGDRVPVDGIVLSGNAQIDLSSLTGESLPQSVDINHHVYSSTLCLSGSLLVRADKVGKDTTFQKIIDLVEAAQNNKIKYQTIAEKFASWYIVIILISALIIFILSHHSSLVLSFLLVTCADDIAIAVPLAYWAAIAVAAKSGIIIKGGNYLERLTLAAILVTDKTGTLTKARLKVTEIISFNSGYSTEKIRYLAAVAESISEHPIARAIIRDARHHQIDFHAPDHFEEHPGGGVQTSHRGQTLFIGSAKFLRNHHCPVSPKISSLIISSEQRGATTVLIAFKRRLIGLINLEDEIKPEVPLAVKNLNSLGVDRIVLLTGDNEYAAKHIAQKTGIREYFANCKPRDKVSFIQKSLPLHGKLLFVGDGVNDAASMAAADVSFAMGAIGADSAIESADIAIMDDKFSQIISTIKLARFTKSVVLGNFTIWAIVNILGLYLVFAGLLTPSQAALYNFATDFLPLFNSFRIFGYSLK